MFEKPVFLYILILESKRKLVNVKKKKSKQIVIQEPYSLSRQNSEALQKVQMEKKKIMIFL